MSEKLVDHPKIDEKHVGFTTTEALDRLSNEIDEVVRSNEKTFDNER